MGQAAAETAADSDLRAAEAARAQRRWGAGDIQLERHARAARADAANGGRCAGDDESADDAVDAAHNADPADNGGRCAAGNAGDAGGNSAGSPEETPVDLPEAVSADDAFDDDADFPAELDDRPPWEEPEDAPKKVLAPVLTQERPAGAWQPDLNLPAHRDGQPVSGGTTNVPAALQQPENIPAAVQPGIQVAKATTEAPSGGPSTTGASATSTFNPEVPYTYPPMMLLRDPLGQQGVNAEEDELRTQRLRRSSPSASPRRCATSPTASNYAL